MTELRNQRQETRAGQGLELAHKTFPSFPGHIRARAMNTRENMRELS